jgi:DNA-binding NarL/FixJ family response regulator
MKVKNEIKVAVADDHKIFRDGLKMALKGRENIEFLWEASDGRDMMRKIQLTQPDVLLMDLRMPEFQSFDAIGQMRKEYPAVKIIVVSMYDDEEMVAKVMETGIHAYLTKTTDPDEIYSAIVSCMTDGFYYNELVKKAWQMQQQHKKK